jgi:hypothetical protein
VAAEDRWWQCPDVHRPHQAGVCQGALFDENPPQLELLHRPNPLSVAREHVYYCKLNTTIAAPARLLWWVSGGGINSGIRATSWLEAALAGRPRTLHRRFGSQGVYTQIDVDATHHRPGRAITALVFSRTETFQIPIPMRVARTIFPRIGENGFLQSTKHVNEHVFVDFYQFGRAPR